MFRIRRCDNVADAETIHALVTELAVFEQQPHAVEQTVADLRRDGFELETPLFYASLAEYEEGGIWKAAGLALWLYSYSTWKGRTFYLEDCMYPVLLR